LRNPAVIGIINIVCGTPITAKFAASLFPPRPLDAHKGAFGHVLNIAGSDRYIGAALLSTRAALRSGSGLVTLASVPRVINAAAGYTPEAIFLDLSDKPEVLEHSLGKATAVVCGMGLAEDACSQAVLEYLFAHTRCPLILDAGALNLPAKKPQLRALLRARGDAPLILTPHPGEASRLLGHTIGADRESREAAAKTLAEEFGAVVALKGHATLIASPAGFLAENCTGNPGLARGGSGDVLAGIIAALCARGIPEFDAAAAGVYLHGLAGDIAAAKFTQEAMLPSDIIEALPDAFAALRDIQYA
jgi:NAD(P)H-hydrate epimerase